MGFDRLQFDTALLNFSGDRKKLKLSVHIFDRIASTNQKLWEFIDRGHTLPIVAIASQQTAGRGQWGRSWQSLPGGLYLSVALATQIKAIDALHLTLSSAWGIANALRNNNIPIVLKWPNDLILQKRKLGGIKIEVRTREGEISQAVIGVGINWTNPVPDMAINLQSFFKQQPTKSSITSLEILAATTTAGILSGHQRYIAEGIETILASYLEILDSMGRSVVIDGCPGEVVGVTSQGELRVRLGSLQDPRSGAPGAATEICLQPGQISLGY